MSLQVHVSLYLLTEISNRTQTDLDSFISSLFYAYIRSTSPPTTAFSPVYIPLLNIPRSGIRLRLEFTAVCKHAAIQPSSLLTLDDLPQGAIKSDNVRWILVDHNKLTGGLEEVPSPHVVGVIDHHEDEGFVASSTDPEPRIVEKAGSCTSLVVRYCRSSWDTISSSSLSIGAAHGQGDGAINDSAFTQAWDAKVAKLALASILIDTSKLTAADKVEQADRDSVEYLEAKLMVSPTDAKSWDRKKYFKELQAAKKDVGDFTLDEILTKDYKQWTEKGMNLGVSSVVRDLEFLISKVDDGDPYGKDAAFTRVLESFMEKRNLAILAVMTKSKSKTGDFQRQLLLQARPDAQNAAMACAESAGKEIKLENLPLDDIEMHTQSSPGKMWRNAWWQRDLGASRKQVAPLLRRAMQQ